MNNILAAKVLMSHLPEITDGAYKTATEIAIEALFKDAKEDYRLIDSLIHPFYINLKLQDYLELTDDEFKRWVK